MKHIKQVMSLTLALLMVLSVIPSVAYGVEAIDPGITKVTGQKGTFQNVFHTAVNGWKVSVNNVAGPDLTLWIKEPTDAKAANILSVHYSSNEYGTGNSVVENVVSYNQGKSGYNLYNLPDEENLRTYGVVAKEGCSLKEYMITYWTRSNDGDAFTKHVNRVFYAGDVMPLDNALEKYYVEEPCRLEVKAIFAPASHTITYTDGVEGEEIFPDQVHIADYGTETPRFEGTLERPPYMFTGWTPSVANTITGDVTYTATWALKTIHVKFTDELGSVLHSDNVTSADTDKVIVPPTITAPVGHTFTGWKNPATGVNYFGAYNFNSLANLVGNDFGETGTVYLTFVVNIVEDAKQIHVQFKYGENSISLPRTLTSDDPYNELVVVNPGAPENQYFVGWKLADAANIFPGPFNFQTISQLIGNQFSPAGEASVLFESVFKYNPNKVTAIFKNASNEVHSSGVVTSAEPENALTVSAPEAPANKKFVGWQLAGHTGAYEGAFSFNALSAVVGDGFDDLGEATLTFDPIFEDTLRQINLIFKDGSGNVLDSSNILRSDSAETPVTFAPTAPAGYAFGGWKIAGNNYAGAFTFAALESFVANSFDDTGMATLVIDAVFVPQKIYVVFMNGAETLPGGVVTYGTSVAAPSVTAPAGKQFVGWKNTVTGNVYTGAYTLDELSPLVSAAGGFSATGEATLTFEAVIVDQKINVVFMNGTETLSSTPVVYGGSVTVPSVTAAAGMKFTGWKNAVGGAAYNGAFNFADLSALVVAAGGFGPNGEATLTFEATFTNVVKKINIIFSYGMLGSETKQVTSQNPTTPLDVNPINIPFMRFTGWNCDEIGLNDYTGTFSYDVLSAMVGNALDSTNEITLTFTASYRSVFG